MDAIRIDFTKETERKSWLISGAMGTCENVMSTHKDSAILMSKKFPRICFRITFFFLQKLWTYVEIHYARDKKRQGNPIKSCEVYVHVFYLCWCPWTLRHWTSLPSLILGTRSTWVGSPMPDRSWWTGVPGWWWWWWWWWRWNVVCLLAWIWYDMMITIAIHIIFHDYDDCNDLFLNACIYIYIYMHHHII